MPEVKEAELVTFDVTPGEYRHWRLTIEGRIATLAMNVNEDCGIKPGYKLKLNSYDLGVDIELYQILQSIRFEHPEVACVVLTSARERMFCAGANIYMLGTSTHAWKVNFCKFTNETRNGMEDSSRHDGLKFLAALNGTCVERVAPLAPDDQLDRRADRAAQLVDRFLERHVDTGALSIARMRSASRA